MRSNIWFSVSVLVVADACATAIAPSTSPSMESSRSAVGSEAREALAGRFTFTIDGMKRVHGVL